jgi:hypothetical protein
VYNDLDGSSGNYETYFSAGIVPSVKGKTPFALRVTIIKKDYESILQTFQEQVKKGELKSSPITLQGQNGTRLDGNFTKDIKGSMVVFKVRDKTLEVYTQSPTFVPDYEQIILPSLTFNI